MDFVISQFAEQRLLVGGTRDRELFDAVSLFGQRSLARRVSGWPNVICGHGRPG
jgi:hypothetical protein